MTCRPPAGEDIADVVELQLYTQGEHGQGSDPVASYVTSGSPVVEELGMNLSASASGSYDVAYPKASFLRSAAIDLFFYLLLLSLSRRCAKIKIFLFVKV